MKNSNLKFHLFAAIFLLNVNLSSVFGSSYTECDLCWNESLKDCINTPHGQQALSDLSQKPFVIIAPSTIGPPVRIDRYSSLEEITRDLVLSEFDHKYGFSLLLKKRLGFITQSLDTKTFGVQLASIKETEDLHAGIWSLYTEPVLLSYMPDHSPYAQGGLYNLMSEDLQHNLRLTHIVSFGQLLTKCTQQENTQQWLSYAKGDLQKTILSALLYQVFFFHPYDILIEDTFKSESGYAVPQTRLVWSARSGFTGPWEHYFKSFASLTQLLDFNRPLSPEIIEKLKSINCHDLSFHLRHLQNQRLRKAICDAFYNFKIIAEHSPNISVFDLINYGLLDVPLVFGNAGTQHLGDAFLRRVLLNYQSCPLELYKKYVDQKRKGRSLTLIEHRKIYADFLFELLNWTDSVWTILRNHTKIPQPLVTQLVLFPNSGRLSPSLVSLLYLGMDLKEQQRHNEIVLRASLLTSGSGTPVAVPIARRGTSALKFSFESL